MQNRKHLWDISLNKNLKLHINFVKTEVVDFLNNVLSLIMKIYLIFLFYMEILFEKKRIIAHNKCMATAGRSQEECAKPQNR